MKIAHARERQIDTCSERRGREPAVNERQREGAPARRGRRFGDWHSIFERDLNAPVLFAGTEHEPLGPLFKGNIGVLSANEDPQRMAKLLKETLKENEKLIVRAGYFDGGVIDEKGVLAVADLPSREQLLTTLLRTIQGGPQQLLGVLQAPARDLLFVLQNFAKKLEDAGGQ